MGLTDGGDCFFCLNKLSLITQPRPHPRPRLHLRPRAPNFSDQASFRQEHQMK